MSGKCDYTVRHEADGWIVFTRDDGTEMFRVQPPTGGFTLADVEALKRHLLKLINQREVGPS